MLLTPAQEWGLRAIQETPAEYIIGIDEVGLGACAGPAIVCGAVFRKDWPGHPEVKDSKKYSGADSLVKHQKRLKALSEHIQPVLQHQELESISHKDIDTLGLGPAIEDAMRRIALRCTRMFPGAIVAIDGDGAKPFLWNASVSMCIPKGDALVPAISAASVIAKTTRDAVMFMSNDLYPGYYFDDHVGYFTQKHEQALREKGPCPIHRLSYKNVQMIMAQRRGI